MLSLSECTLSKVCRFVLFDQISPKLAKAILRDVGLTSFSSQRKKKKECESGKNTDFYN